MSTTSPEPTAAVAPEPAAANVKPSFAARIFLRYERIDHALRIRWPFVAILQPLPVLGYVLISWAVAAVLAWRLRGTILHPRDPLSLSLVWLFLSICIAAIWLSRQWKERTSLPHPVALPRAWSFVPTFATLLLLLSPSIVWERLSCIGVRTLLSDDDCAILVGTFQPRLAIYENDDRLRPPSPLAWLMEQAPALEAQRGEWFLDSNYRSCRILFTPHHPDAARRIRGLLPPDVLDSSRAACDTWLSRAEASSPTRYPRINGQHGPTTGQGGYPHFPFEEIADAIDRHASVHGIGGDVYSREVWDYQALILAITMFLAAATTLVGVVPLGPLRRGLLGMMFINFIVLFLVTTSVLHLSVWRKFDASTTPWLVFAFPIAAAGHLILLLRFAPRGRRSPSTDTAFAVMWLLPVSVLVNEVAMAKDPWMYRSQPTISALIADMHVQRWVDYTADLPSAIMATFLLYALSSPFAPAAFTRYRRLPCTK